MPIHVALHHRSHYSYDRLVGHMPHIVRLRPAPHCRTPILSYALRILPPQHFINWQQDPFGNYLARLVFPEKSRELLIEVDLVAELAIHNPFDFFLEPGAEHFPFDYEPALKKQLATFLEAGPAGPLLEEYLPIIARTRVRTSDFLVELNRRLWREIKYLIRLEPGVQTPDETLSRRSGSCRDSGWLLVQLVRSVSPGRRLDRPGPHVRPPGW
jgi:transglutaminase-like putative cysteine protease